LVFDKSVDEYINKIQKHLPSITEKGSSSSRKGMKKFNVSFLADIDENASFVVESSAFDELPSLVPAGMTSELDRSTNGRGVEEKRDPNKSLSSKFMKSIKGMRGPKTPKIQNKGVVQGDEEKFFPDTHKTNDDNSKRFGANRCLLNADGGDDD
jgi:hypothetical protein